VRTRRQLLAFATLVGFAGRLTAQQPTTVSGHVNREDGAPLAAATVSIPSLGISTTSRGDGSYAMLVPASHLGERLR
jgi:hypothetical protein